MSAEAEAAGRGYTRGCRLNIGKTIAEGNMHTPLLDRCYIVNVFVSTTVAFFQQRTLLVVGAVSQACPGCYIVDVFVSITVAFFQQHTVALKRSKTSTELKTRLFA